MTGRMVAFTRGGMRRSFSVRVDADKARMSRLRRRLYWWGKCWVNARGSWDFIFLTLTYADADAWSPRQVSACIKRIREWARRRGVPISYAWVCELQKRGAPHYHIIIVVPRGVRLPKPDKCGWWSYGYTRIELARHRGGVVAYLQKYMSKGGHVRGEARLPKGARAYAVSISRAVVHCIPDMMRGALKAQTQAKWVRDALMERGFPLDFVLRDGILFFGEVAIVCRAWHWVFVLEKP